MRWQHSQYNGMPGLRRWWLKCTLQMVLSHIPMGERINNLLRRETLFNSFDQGPLKQAILHIEMLNQAGRAIKNETVMEIGAGWQPVNAYLYRIAGCGKVLLCDIHRHINRELLVLTVNHLRENAQIISELLKIDRSCIDKSLPRISSQSFETLLEESGFEYKAPFDLARTNLPSASMGIVNSRATLEHISPQDLREIFREMRRVIKPSGAMVHSIDHSDHWEHFDHSISRINFLKFPDWWWNIIGENSLAYQNRLRSCEYIDMIREAGFRILRIDTTTWGQALTDASKMKIIRRYWDLTPEEIAIITTHLIAEPLLETDEGRNHKEPFRC